MGTSKNCKNNFRMSKANKCITQQFLNAPKVEAEIMANFWKVSFCYQFTSVYFLYKQFSFVYYLWLYFMPF